MKYKGKLYGRIGDMYFDTSKTSEDWDNLENKVKELQDIVNKNCTIPVVNDWLSFDTPPQAGQEILIVWETFPPEKRILTEEDLQKDWTGMRWLPIPAWS